MINITKNTTNTIVLELTTLHSVSDPNYLFEFIDEVNTSEAPIYFTTPDISAYTNRYNEFLLTEDDAGSTTGGNNIPLNLKNGQFKYNIYVTASVIDINDVSAIIANDPIETSRMIVFGENQIVDSVYL